MRVELQGQAALIVGDAGGIAPALAAALEANGARTLLRDVAGVAGDAAAATVADAGQRLGRLDMLVLVPPASGESSGGSEHAGPDTPDGAGFDQIAFIAGHCRAAEKLLSQGGGRMLVVTSALGLLPSRAHPERGAQAAGALSYVRSLAMRLGPAGVRINSLCLGSIGADSPPSSTLLSGDTRWLSHVPLAKPGTLADVVHAALFLLDPENSYMTGHALALDGGWTAGYARDF